MILRPILAAFALALCATLPLRGAEAPDPRAELQQAQEVLDRAVSEVSRPSVHFVLGGREATRGYRLKGVGAFFVLPPRTLPIPDNGRVIVFNRRAPDARSRKLSKQQEQELRAMQAQVEEMQREAEAAQREGERALENVERNVRIRLIAPGAPPALEPPPAPEAPDVPMAPDAAEAFPPPPWRFWFGTSEPTDDRTPERVIADVQSAVTAALEDLAPGLRTLPAEEAVLVAVDFLPTRGFDLDTPSGLLRSLIVKVKKRDLSDRAAGKITPEELRRRIEYTQY